MNYNTIVCNALGIDTNEMDGDQLSCSLQHDDGSHFTVHVSINAKEEIATLTGLLDAAIPERITQDIFMELCHASANPLIADFGVGIIPGTEHFVVFKIIPLSLLNEQYVKALLSELILQIKYWNKFFGDQV